MSPAEASGLRVHVVLWSPASVITNIWFSNGTWVSGQLDIQTVRLPASKNKDGRLEPLCFDLYGDEFGYQSLSVYHRFLPQGQLKSQQLQNNELTTTTKKPKGTNLQPGPGLLLLFSVSAVGGLDNLGLNVRGRHCRKGRGTRRHPGVKRGEPSISRSLPILPGSVHFCLFLLGACWLTTTALPSICRSLLVTPSFHSCLRVIGLSLCQHPGDISASPLL